MLEKLSYEHKSYLIGFIHGDGHLSKYIPKGKISPVYSLCITQSDIRNPGILDKIADILKPIIEIHKYKGTKPGVSVIQTGIQEFCKEIALYVPTGKKCHTTEPPINMEGFDKYAYLRGLTDADGSIGIRNRKGSISPFWTQATSSITTINFILDDIESLFNIRITPSTSTGNGCYNIELCNEKAVIYTNLLYKNSTIHLDKKYNKHLKLQEWQRTSNILEYWSSYEDAIALDNTKSIKEKSVILGRTKQAVILRRFRLGVGNKNSWSEEDITTVLDPTKTVQEKAILLNRTICAVRHKITRLNNGNKN